MIKKIILTGFCISLSACVTNGTLHQVSTALMGEAAAPITEQDVSAGLKEALLVGTNRTISKIGYTNGFWLNDDVRIPLPESYQRLHTTLAALGLGHVLDDVHLKLNQAASRATAHAKPIFMNAITALTFEDAYSILQGGETAATDLLYSRTKQPLTASFTPIIQEALQSVGFIQEVENVRQKLMLIPFANYLAPQLHQDIADYAVEWTIHGMFKTLAEEEAEIRKNPVKRTTALLQKVFALQK